MSYEPQLEMPFETLQSINASKGLKKLDHQLDQSHFADQKIYCNRQQKLTNMAVSPNHEIKKPASKWPAHGWRCLNNLSIKPDLVTAH